VKRAHSQVAREKRTPIIYGVDSFPLESRHYHITTIVDGGGGKPHWTDWLWIVGFMALYLAVGTGFLYFLRLYLRSIVQP
jgi:hypothetical protein